MQTRIIEATSTSGNWGRFLLARYDTEWHTESLVSPGYSVLDTAGTAPDALWVMDVVTGEAALFRPGGSAQADLDKHRIWVCPLFGPFLEWLYARDVGDLTALPNVVGLGDVPLELAGYRRPGIRAIDLAADGVAHAAEKRRQGRL